MFSILPRILSIQSHIVHGYVGNKAATFPLQCLGFNVDCINTVHLSNHPAYSGGFKGQMLNGDDFVSLIEGLENNNLLGYDILLSGYIRSEEILLKLREVFLNIQIKNSNALFVCDPVLGDNGAFYVPQKLLEVYRDSVLPFATVITPNYFEAQVLSGMNISNISDAIKVCKKFHEIGVKICLLKGLPLAGPSGPLSMVLSSAVAGTSVYRIDVPRIEGSLSGCGDLCTASLTAFLYRHPMDLGRVLDLVASVMTDVTRATAARGAKELLIVDSIQSYLNPDAPEKSSYVVSGPVTCVIFSLDGTLTEPGAFDYSSDFQQFAEVSDDNSDLLSQIASVGPIERQAAEIPLRKDELRGCGRQTLRTDATEATSETLQTLKRLKVRTAVVSRNSPAVVDVLSAWEAAAGDVWVVCDNAEDLAGAKLAGCRTCLLVSGSPPPAAGLSDVRSRSTSCDIVVSSLKDFLDHVLPHSS